MDNQQQQVSRRVTLMNIRKLAALDIAFHGPRLILAEFALAIIICGTLGALSLSFFFRTSDHPLFAGMIGLALSWIALNYIPLFLHALSLVKRQSAKLEVASELEDRKLITRRHGFQSMILLLLPLVVPVLALVQEIQRRRRREK